MVNLSVVIYRAIRDGKNAAWTAAVACHGFRDLAIISLDLLGETQRGDVFLVFLKVQPKVYNDLALDLYEI